MNSDTQKEIAKYLDFNNRDVRRVFDQANRRQWCIERAAQSFAMSADDPAQLIARATAIEAWLLENKAE